MRLLLALGFACLLAHGFAAPTRLAVVYPLPSVDALDRELAAAKDAADLMVVKFSQPRCNSCRALAPKFDQLARGNPRVRCFEVNERTPLGRLVCDANDVQALPTVALYVDGVKAYQDTMQAKDWAAFLEKVDDSLDAPGP